jgi:membrane-bound serine protease (ClpP class)
MTQKLENDTAALLRSLVTKRGRNSELAEQAVLKSRSFTDKEALDQRLIDLTARDDQDLIAQLDGRQIARFDGSKRILHLAGAVLTPYQKNYRERIQSAVSDPNLALALILLGVLGVYVEFTQPGLILPGVAGAILALLGLSAMSILPINWAGAGLLLLALALFVLEAKFTSHGILGAGGAAAMILGALLLVDSPIPEMRIHLGTAIALTLPFAVITVFLLTLVLRARRSKVATGSAGMLGESGVALTDLAPSGRIFVHGEYWNAISTAEVHSGARVRVTAIHGLTLTVEPLSQPTGD